MLAVPGQNAQIEQQHAPRLQGEWISRTDNEKTDRSARAKTLRAAGGRLLEAGRVDAATLGTITVVFRRALLEQGNQVSTDRLSNARLLRRVDGQPADLFCQTTGSGQLGVDPGPLVIANRTGRSRGLRQLGEQWQRIGAWRRPGLFSLLVLAVVRLAVVRRADARRLSNDTILNLAPRSLYVSDHERKKYQILYKYTILGRALVKAPTGTLHPKTQPGWWNPAGIRRQATCSLARSQSAFESRA